MKITEKFLTIPPYLSVRWQDVCAISKEGEVLIVELSSKQRVEIPGLTIDEQKEIFVAHQQHLEKTESATASERSSKSTSSASSDATMFNESLLRAGLANFQQFASFLQHNSSKANAPNLPKEITEKVADMARMFTSGDMDLLPKSEPHCNCPYCQIARIIHGEEESERHKDCLQADQIPLEEEVEEKLVFSDWRIERLGDKLYRVTNKLDPTMVYQVFLGTPVGCTCGQKGCEHLLAVLRD